MEGKELNLCELLKGCKDIEVYSLLEGVTYIRNVDDSLIETVYEEYGEKGEVFVGGVCQLYPSRALYEKYPLDAKKAWDEWASDRKPKRWILTVGEEYFSISGCAKIIKLKYLDNAIDAELERVYNRFRTEEEAQQAAEAVRECLEKFHEKNSEK